TFNVMTKQPTGRNQYTVQAMIGTSDFYRLSADLDGTFSPKVLYRLNVMGMKTNSFVKYDFNDRFLAAPVLKFRLSEKASLTAEYTCQFFRYGNMSPIVMSPRGSATLPSDFTIEENSIKPYEVQDHTAFLTY